MKKLLLISFALTVAFSATVQAKKVTLKSGVDSLNYAIGTLFGSSLNQANFGGLSENIDFNIVSEGLKDALSGNSRIDELEAYEIFTVQVERLNELKFAQYKKEGEDFLAKNAKRPGVVVLESGLQYEVIEQGSGASPSEYDNFLVNYCTKTFDGTVVDESDQDEGPTQLSIYDVIQGCQEGLMLMPEGSKYILYIPYELGYGSISNSNCQAYSALVCEVELVSVIAGEDGYDYSEEEIEQDRDAGDYKFIATALVEPEPTYKDYTTRHAKIYNDIQYIFTDNGIVILSATDKLVQEVRFKNEIQKWNDYVVQAGFFRAKNNEGPDFLVTRNENMQDKSTGCNVYSIDKSGQIALLGHMNVEVSGDDYDSYTAIEVATLRLVDGNIRLSFGGNGSVIYDPAIERVAMPREDLYYTVKSGKLVEEGPAKNLSVFKRIAQREKIKGELGELKSFFMGDMNNDGEKDMVFSIEGEDKIHVYFLSKGEVKEKLSFVPDFKFTMDQDSYIGEDGGLMIYERNEEEDSWSFWLYRYVDGQFVKESGQSDGEYSDYQLEEGYDSGDVSFQDTYDQE